MVQSYQPEIDKKKLEPGTRVEYWKSVYKNGIVTIVSKDEHVWKMSNEWYQTKEGVRISSDEITHVFR